jgi:uncharacterized RDD family membrane protein YckC
MKTIDVRTTQNVTITYELAHVRDRILAFVVDQIIILFAYLIIFWILALLFSNNMSSDFAQIGIYLLLVPVVMLYTLISEYLMHGQTLGKKAMKIKVIKLDGRQPEFYDYMNRWILRIIDIWGSSGVVGTIIISSSDFSQRLGDITSNTTVVRINNRSTISLKDILKIDTRQNYVPQYPAISNFREEDILLIKQTIERYHQFRNRAHKEAILLLSDTLKKKLEITEPITEHIKFLKTLVKDYIVLTR